jgi:hypothetical protein
MSLLILFRGNAVTPTGQTRVHTTSVNKRGRLQANHSTDVQLRKRQITIQDFNGTFEDRPTPNTEATNTGNRWIDGTVGGSATRQWYWAIPNGGGGGGGASLASFDTTVFRSGTTSMKLETISGGIAVSNFRINAPNTASLAEEAFIIQPNTTYTLSGWVKTSNVANASAYMEFRQYSGTATPLTTTATNKIAGTNDWTFLTGTFTTAANAVYGAVLIRNASTVPATAWYDDISIAQVSSPSHTTDTLMRTRASKSFTTDAVKRLNTTRTHSTDITRSTRPLRSHTTSVSRRLSSSKSHSTDFLKRGRFTRQHATDVLLRRTYPRYIVNDSFASTTDGWDQYASSMGGMEFRDTNAANYFSAPASLMFSGSLVDTAIMKTITLVPGRKYYARGMVKGAAGQMIAIQITGAGLSSFVTMDGTFKQVDWTFTAAQATTQFGFYSPAMSQTFYLDDVLLYEATTHNTDVNKRKGGNKLITTDVNKRKTNNLRSASTDVVKRAVTAKSHTTNTLKRLQAVRVHNTDTLRRLRTIRAHSTDTLLELRASIAHTTSVAKRLGGLSRSQNTDVLKRKAFTRQHTTDLVKFKGGLNRTHSTNTFLRTRVNVSHLTETSSFFQRRRNYVPNPSFENGTILPWRAGPDQVSLSTIGAVHGTYSIKFSTTSSFQNMNFDPAPIYVIAGQAYTASAYVTTLAPHTGGSNGTNTTATLYARWNRADGTQIREEVFGSIQLAGQTWTAQRVQGTKVAPAEAVTLRLQVYQYGTGDAYWDAFQLEDAQTESFNQGFDVIPPQSQAQILTTNQNAIITGNGNDLVTSGGLNRDALRKYRWMVNIYNVNGSFPRGAMYDTAITHNGGASLKLVGSDVKERVNITLGRRNYGDLNDPSDIQQNLIPVQPLTAYKFGFWYKTDVTAVTGTPHTTNPMVSVIEHTNTGYQGNQNRFYREDTVTQDWTYGEITFTTAATTRYVNVYGAINGNATNYYSGTLWFDEFTLTPTGQNFQATPYFDGSFENAVWRGDAYSSQSYTLANVYLDPHTTDIVKRLNSVRSHSTGVLSRSTNLLTHSTSAMKRVRVALAHSTDVLRLAKGIKTHTTSTVKRVQVAKSHGTSVNKRKSTTLVSVTDTYARKANQRQISTDVSKRKALIPRVHTTNALKRLGGLRSHNTDITPLYWRRRNLILNPSFEVNTTGVGGTSNLTFTRDTTTSVFGSASMRVDYAGATGGKYFTINAPNWQVGKTYIFSAYLKQTLTSGRTAIAIKAFGTSGLISSVGYDITGNLNDWTRVWTSMTIPEGTTSVQWIPIQDSANGPFTQWWDGFVVEEANLFQLNPDFENYIPADTGYTTSPGRYITNLPTGSVTENGTNLLFGRGGSVGAKIDTTEKHSGEASLKIALLSTSAYIETRMGGGNTYYNRYGYQMLPNTRYRARVWMKTNYISGDSASGAYFAFLETNSAGTASGQTTTYTPVKTTTDWTEYVMTFTTRADTIWAHPEFRIYGHNGAATLQMEAWFDDLEITQLDPTPYFDGTETNANWRGTANNSQSYTIAWATPINLRTDVLKRSAGVLIHSTDFVKRSQNTLSHSTNVNKRKVTNVAHTTNTLLRKRDIDSHTTSVNKRERETDLHTTDTFKRYRVLKSHTTNVLKRERDSVVTRTDVLKRKKFTRTHTTQTFKRVRKPVAHTTDFMGYRQFAIDHTTDTVIRLGGRKLVHSTGVNISAAKVMRFSTDTFLEDLRGNKRVLVDGIWYTAPVYVLRNGEWKRAFVYELVDGVWTKTPRLP